MGYPKKTFVFTKRLAKRVGREKRLHPCSADFDWYSYNVQVAFREWEDHYTILDRVFGEHVASFMDLGTGKLEVTYVREGWLVKEV